MGQEEEETVIDESLKNHEETLRAIDEQYEKIRSLNEAFETDLKKELENLRKCIKRPRSSSSEQDSTCNKRPKVDHDDVFKCRY